MMEAIKYHLTSLFNVAVGVREWTQIETPPELIDAFIRALYQPLLNGESFTPGTIVPLQVAETSTVAEYISHVMKPFPVIALYTGRREPYPIRTVLFHYLHTEVSFSLASVVVLSTTGGITVGLRRAMTDWLFFASLIPTLIHFSFVLIAMFGKLVGELARRHAEAALRYILEFPEGPLLAISAMCGVAAAWLEVMSRLAE
jgi:hypothetical protein